MVKATGKISLDRQCELIIGNINSLSTLPEIMATILSQGGCKELNISTISEMIESDPALMARVFSLAQSEGVLFDNDKPVISQILSNMSNEKVRDVIMSMKVFDVIEKDYDPDSDRQIPRKQLGLHAIAVACCAKEIGSFVLDESGVQHAFTAGLLHDIGKLAIDEAMPKSFEKIARQAKLNGCLMSTMEKKYLGLDHAVVGKRLGQKWCLPKEVIIGIWLHHSDTEIIVKNLPEYKMAGVVQLADMLARLGGIGESGSCDHISGIGELSEALGLSAGQLEQVKQRFLSEVSRRSELLGLISPGGPAAYCSSIRKAAAELSRDNSVLTADNLWLSTNFAHMSFAKEFLFGINANMSADQAAGVLANGWKKHYHTGPVIVYLVRDDDNMIEVVAACDDGSVERCFVERPEEVLLPAEQDQDKFAIVDAEEYLGWLLDQINFPINVQKSKALGLVCKGKLTGGLIFEQRMPADLSKQSDMFKVVSSIGASIIDIAKVSHDQVRLAERFAEILGQLRESRGEGSGSKSLEAIAEIAAGAGHELNTPLAVISGRAQLLYEGEKDKDKKQMLKQIQDRAKEISGIISELMDYAKPREAAAKSISLSVLVSGAIERTAKKHNLSDIEVELDRIDELGDVCVDKEQIIRVIGNILSNALESFDGGNGPIRISGRCSQSKSATSFEIIDSGHGMSGETINKAAQPFYSARPAGRGRGMGLAHAARLLMLNKGKMQIKSTPGKGTTVTVTLPKS
ncbi:MAG: HDOD domain-containing protein [Sedimentisphaerales bacterium]|nr:HDOD domain-containing protein [Sedimentisphaerales bacterium]